LILNRREDSLKLEAVKQVWSRDGLLISKHSNEATLLQSNSPLHDHKQVELNTFNFHASVIFCEEF